MNERWTMTLGAALAAGLVSAVAWAADADRAAHEANRQLGRGVNLGNMLEAPSEGAWGVRVEERYFELIRQAGFDSVRIPIRWSARADQQPPYTIQEEFFQRVDEVLEQALAQELTVVINMHHYDEIFEQPEGHRERFLAMWRQIAERYQDLPQQVYFELLNEPHAQLTPELWNGYLRETLDVVRRTNPERIVVIGPGSWNAISHLEQLELPEDDRRIVVTFHYYLPFQFTHQGAQWVEGSEPWLGTRWLGTAEERQAVEADLDRAVRWGERHRRPLYMGEFGAYSRADMESRVRWTQFVSQAAEERGISWAYWELAAGFGVYDRERDTWREGLLHALLAK